jgi:hypothetical protein
MKVNLKKLFLSLLILACPLAAESPKPTTHKNKLIASVAILVRDTAFASVFGGLLAAVLNTRLAVVPPQEGARNLIGENHPIIFGMKWGAAFGALLGLGEVANEFAP